MDFLLMSYILYTYDLALPVIAAGMGKIQNRIGVMKISFLRRLGPQT